MDEECRIVVEKSAISRQGVIKQDTSTSDALTKEQARWRIIELLEVGFHPRRMAKLIAMQAVVYYWQ